MGRRALIALIVSLFVFGIARNTAQAQQPLPPRPTVQPPAAATATARPDRHTATPETGARITGTVIDLATGAPTPGIMVQIGDTTVTSDANGNYGRDGLAAGNYVVVLVLPAGGGTPEQAPLTITLEAGATVVQHLAFRSTPVAAAPAIPTATVDTAMPAQLPATGAADSLWLAWLVLGTALVSGGLVLRRVWRR